MKKIILFFALIAFSAACASEKKQANASENKETGSTSHVVINGNNAKTEATTAKVEAYKIYIEETNPDGSTKTFEDVLQNFCRFFAESAKKVHPPGPEGPQVPGPSLAKCLQIL